MEIKITKDNFEVEVLNSNVPVLVDFWASWCGPCKMIAPIVEEIANEYEGRLKVGKVNIDEEGEIAVQYKIMSIPTLMLFENGKVEKMTLGYMPKAELIKELGL